MARKSEPEAAPPKSARERRVELEGERKRITTEILRLEGMGHLPTISGDAARVIHARAVALFLGEAEPAAVIADGGEQLTALYGRRQVIDRAISLAVEHESAEEHDRLRRLMADEQPQWIAAVRKRALLAVALRLANQELEAFKRRYRQLGSSLPTAGFKLLGTGAVPDELDRCLEALIRDGIITRKEAGFE